MSDPLMIESKSQPGTFHLIQRRTDGRFTCSCRGFAFRGMCRHVLEIDPGSGIPPPQTPEQKQPPVTGDAKPMFSRFKTYRGYDMFEVVSAMQKAIRRGDARKAGYWAVELHKSGRAKHAWKRLLVISAEDCADFVTSEVESLWRAADLSMKSDGTVEEVFIAKAAIILSKAHKSRDADHMSVLVYSAKFGLTDEELMADLQAAGRIEIPDEAIDCHTMKGKRMGKTKLGFMKSEYESLSPRIPGLFDGDIEKLNSGDPDAVKQFEERKKNKPQPQ